MPQVPLRGATHVLPAQPPWWQVAGQAGHPTPIFLQLFFAESLGTPVFFYKFWQAGHSTPNFLQFFVEHFWQAGYPTQANYQVVLTHDIAHRPGGDLDAKAELVRFLRMALDKGYEFRTVDTYLSD